MSNDRRSVRAGAGSWGVPRLLSAKVAKECPRLRCASDGQAQKARKFPADTLRLCASALPAVALAKVGGKEIRGANLPMNSTS